MISDSRVLSLYTVQTFLNFVKIIQSSSLSGCHRRGRLNSPLRLRFRFKLHLMQLS